MHDKNLSWYWEIGLMKFEKDKKVYRVILKNYDVMNCNNRTLGHKTLQALDYDLNSKENFTYADNKIEFKPLEPSAYSDKLFNLSKSPDIVRGGVWGRRPHTFSEST